MLSMLRSAFSGDKNNELSCNMFPKTNTTEKPKIMEENNVSFPVVYLFGTLTHAIGKYDFIKYTIVLILKYRVARSFQSPNVNVITF